MASDIPGQLLIWLAMAANIISGLAYFKTARGDKSFSSLALRSYHVLFIMSSLATAYLFYLFFSHDFNTKYVFEYSDRSLPFFYLLSAFWGGQEGTYLLWLWISVIFGYVIIHRGGRYSSYAMSVYSIVNLFLLAMLIKLSPFAQLPFPARDGAGLNPLLQDPWMVIHPPVVFVGYAAAGVPFAIVMAALIMNHYTDWVKHVFPWQAITALMLAGGNILGGYWAYKTLGWGGYWGWDPVENSSLIPWFVSLALLHGLILEKSTGALRKTNMLLTALVYILVVYGTFLTRSGVLADFSVHSFVDLGANVFLIGFLIFFVLTTLVLFLSRAKDLGHVPINYSFYGRQFFLFAGLLSLFLFALVVLFWSSLPLITSLLTVTPRAADVTTYNDFALPFGILVAFLLALAPFAGNSMVAFIPRHWKLKLALVVIASTLVGIGMVLFAGATVIFLVLFVLATTGLIMFIQKPDLAKKLVPVVIVMHVSFITARLAGLKDPLYIFFLTTAAMCIIANLIVLVRLSAGGWRLMGGNLVHFGFGIMLIGILGSSAMTSNRQLVLPIGESETAYGVSVSYRGMESDITRPRNRLILDLSEGDRSESARPEMYYSQRLDGLMKKPYLKKKLFYDLYYSPQQLREGTEPEKFLLHEGELREIGDYRFTFLGFVMNQHDLSSADLSVAARLQIEGEGRIDTIEPSMQMVTGEKGDSSLKERPVKFGANGQYSVAVDQILADEKAVVLKVPSWGDLGEPETLILDVSRKPVINLLWGGTTLILIGSLIIFFRRWSQLS